MRPEVRWWLGLLGTAVSEYVVFETIEGDGAVKLILVGAAPLACGLLLRLIFRGKGSTGVSDAASGDGETTAVSDRPSR